MRVYRLFPGLCLATVSMAGVVSACKTANQAETQMKTYIDTETNLAALFEDNMAVSLQAFGMGGGWRPNAGCDGKWAISMSRGTSLVQVSACINQKTSDAERSISGEQREELLKILRSWKVEPVPSSAFSQPCPSENIGGFSASAISEKGSAKYNMYVCNGMPADGILVAPERAEGQPNTLEVFIKSLFDQGSSGDVVPMRTYIDTETNLAALLQDHMAISLQAYGMGGWRPNAGCDGKWAISVPRGSNWVQVSACINQKTSDSKGPISSEQREELLKILSSWKVEPVPSSAFSQPCPSENIGGFSASAISRVGTAQYNMYVCNGMPADGILVAPERAEGQPNTLEAFIKSLFN